MHHHNFDPTLTFHSAAELRLYRLRYLCRWRLSRIARHLGVHESTISRRLKKLNNLYHLNLTRPRRPAPERRRFRPISLSKVSDI